MKTLRVFTYHTDFTTMRSEEISYIKFVARPVETINNKHIRKRVIIDSLVAMIDTARIF